jgi:hypothetical protein
VNQEGDLQVQFEMLSCYTGISNHQFLHSIALEGKTVGFLAPKAKKIHII